MSRDRKYRGSGLIVIPIEAIVHVDTRVGYTHYLSLTHDSCVVHRGGEGLSTLMSRSVS